jgi:hypothetical protein
MTYADVTYADTFFSTRLHAEAWTLITDAAIKAKALASAIDVIEALPFGYVVPDTVLQPAHCWIAIALLDAVDPTIEFANLNVTNSTLGGTRTAYDVANPPEHILYGVPSVMAWRLLKPYIADPRSVNLIKV